VQAGQRELGAGTAAMYLAHDATTTPHTPRSITSSSSSGMGGGVQRVANGVGGNSDREIMLGPADGSTELVPGAWSMMNTTSARLLCGAMLWTRGELGPWDSMCDGDVTHLEPTSLRRAQGADCVCCVYDSGVCRRHLRVSVAQVVRRADRDMCEEGS